jgi:uncharacterized lipoprotein YddW (UPF0748 family)
MGRLTMRVAIALAGSAALMALALAVTHAASSAPAGWRADEEVRGLWVLRSSITSPEKIHALVRTATEGGYNTLMVQVRGRGDAYFEGGTEPRADELAAQPSTFDPLGTTLAAAHAAGLKVHAWFNVNLVSSATTLPRSRDHIVAKHPGWLMVPRALAGSLARMDPRNPAYVGQLARWTRTESATIEGLYLSPIPELSQAYTIDVVRALVERYPIDGLHLDYIRYPSAEFDYGAAALTAFADMVRATTSEAERGRLDGLSARDPLAWVRAYPDAWIAFRERRLTTLVARIRTTARQARPDLVLSAAVVPGADDARARKLQDWAGWTRDGLLDVICPMAYAADAPGFTAQIVDATRSANGIPVWAGIGAWRLPVAQAADHLRAARRAGVAGVLLFSYDGLVSAAPKGAYFSELRPALTEPRVSDRR